MAAISRELGNSLDALRQAIVDATDYLAKSPGAYGLSVVIEGLCVIAEIRTMLEFSEHGGQPAILVVNFALDSDDDADTIVRPLLETPVNERLVAAKQIPELINLAKKKTAELPSEIDAVVQEISSAIGTKAGRTKKAFTVTSVKQIADEVLSEMRGS